MGLKYPHPLCSYAFSVQCLLLVGGTSAPRAPSGLPRSVTLLYRFAMAPRSKGKSPTAPPAAPSTAVASADEAPKYTWEVLDKAFAPASDDDIAGFDLGG